MRIKEYCEAQARVRQGQGRDGPVRQKALKLKPLPRAYIKVGCLFIRMVSAYRDKIERCHQLKPNSSEPDPEKDWYFKKYGSEMIKRYRRKYLEKFGTDSLTPE